MPAADEQKGAVPDPNQLPGQGPPAKRRNRSAIILVMILLCTNFLILKSLIGMLRHYQLKDPFQSSAARLLN